MKTHTGSLLDFVFRSTFTWGISSLALGTAIGFLGYKIMVIQMPIFEMLYVWVYFCLIFFLWPALAMGFFQSIWFYLANNAWGSPEKRQGFALFSGLVFGLLCFVPDFAFFGFIINWKLFSLFIASSVLGGVGGAYANQKNLYQLAVNRPKTAWIKIILSYCFVVLCLTYFEFTFFGEQFLSKFSVIPALAVKAQNVGIQPKGEFLSGVYKLTNQQGEYDFRTTNAMGGTNGPNLNYKNGDELAQIEAGALPEYKSFIDQVNAFNAALTIVQNDSQLNVENYFGSEWTGSLDDHLNFMIRGNKPIENGTVYFELRGTFRDRDHFDYSILYNELGSKSRRSSNALGQGERLK